MHKAIEKTKKKGQWLYDTIFTSQNAGMYCHGDPAYNAMSWQCGCWLNGIFLCLHILWQHEPCISRVLCQKQVSRAGRSNYIPQYLWDYITFPCPWYLLLAQHTSYNAYVFHNQHPYNVSPIKWLGSHEFCMSTCCLHKLYTIFFTIIDLHVPTICVFFPHMTVIDVSHDVCFSLHVSGTIMFVLISITW